VCSMDDNRLSVRQWEVLEAASRFSIVSVRVLEQHFESRFPPDELQLVLDSLEENHLIRLQPADRSKTVVLTALGRRVMEGGL
jgi:DNA-binding MarR family transcriptional regulator